jgi:hypothetical protein
MGIHTTVLFSRELLMQCGMITILGAFERPEWNFGQKDIKAVSMGEAWDESRTRRKSK